MIMATEFNTQVGNGEYRLQFETDNKAHYLIILMIQDKDILKPY